MLINLLQTKPSQIWTKPKTEPWTKPKCKPYLTRRLTERSNIHLLEYGSNFKVPQT